MSAQLYDRNEYPTGTQIFAEGDEGLHLYIIEKGVVEIYKMVGQEHIVLATRTQGSVFGEMALIETAPRSANAIVIDDCVLLRIPVLAVNDYLEASPPFIQNLLHVLISTYRSNINKLTDQ